MNETLPHDHGVANESHYQEILNNNDFEKVSEVFNLLGDLSRLRIFWVLCHCEECVINIAAMVNMTSPAASHHLRLLKSLGLITSRRDGKEVYYKAADTNQVTCLHNTIEELISIHCPFK